MLATKNWLFGDRHPSHSWSRPPAARPCGGNRQYPGQPGAERQGVSIIIAGHGQVAVAGGNQTGKDQAATATRWSSPECIRFASMDTPELHRAHCDPELRLGLLAKRRMVELLAPGKLIVHPGDPRRPAERPLWPDAVTIKVKGKDVGEILIADIADPRTSGIPKLIRKISCCAAASCHRPKGAVQARSCQTKAAIQGPVGDISFGSNSDETA